MPAREPTFLGRLSILLMVIIFGVPAGWLLIIGTWGTILIPLVVAAYAAPLFALHYVVWGRALSRRLRQEGKS
jgi:hypothetical protein